MQELTLQEKINLMVCVRFMYNLKINLEGTNLEGTNLYLHRSISLGYDLASNFVSRMLVSHNILLGNSSIMNSVFTLSLIDVKEDVTVYRVVNNGKYISSSDPLKVVKGFIAMTNELGLELTYNDKKITSYKELEEIVTAQNKEVLEKFAKKVATEVDTKKSNPTTSGEVKVGGVLTNAATPANPEEKVSSFKREDSGEGKDTSKPDLEKKFNEAFVGKVDADEEEYNNAEKVYSGDVKNDNGDSKKKESDTLTSWESKLKKYLTADEVPVYDHLLGNDNKKYPISSSSNNTPTKK